ncbi:MAG: glycosyltransferase family 4 protein [Phycisphaerales bacterium]|nr:glycosyltransferase family 4 protein [Phycisphaerales bacterium]
MCAAIGANVRVVVTSQHRYARTPDGRVWTDAKYAYSFWRRYLDVFSRVRVVARVRPIETAPADWQPVSGDGVEVAPLPFVRGAWGWVKNLAAVRAAARTAIEPRDAVMLRAPGEVACCVDGWLWKQRRPYGVEVVGDPRELFAPGAVRSPFRPLLRALYPRRVRLECGRAACAAYVTRETLQRSYPPPVRGFTTHYSSIELRDEAFAAGPRTQIEPIDVSRPGRLLFVGTFGQMYKGPDVAIRALRHCRDAGMPVQLRMCGDGQHRAEMEALAGRLGVREWVEFLGQVDAARVRQELDAADVFISPARQEGLPRAVIEAFARAAPTVASNVGGTAELVDEPERIEPGSTDVMAATLARRVIDLLRDPARRERLSARNLAMAAAYHERELSQRRRRMYEHLRKETERWMGGS